MNSLYKSLKGRLFGVEVNPPIDVSALVLFIAVRWYIGLQGPGSSVIGHSRLTGLLLRDLILGYHTKDSILLTIHPPNMVA